MNLVLSDAKESIIPLSGKGDNSTIRPANISNRKNPNPFRPWDNDEEEEEEEINDDEEDCYVDVERQSPIPPDQKKSHSSMPHDLTIPEKSLSSASENTALAASMLNVSQLLGGSLPAGLPSAPHLVTANHQQLLQASQNILALSKLYPSLVDINTLASVAAAAQLAASTAAAGAIIPPMPTAPATSPPAAALHSNLPTHCSRSPILPQHRPHLADIQGSFASVAPRQSIEPEQEEPLALIKKPTQDASLGGGRNTMSIDRGLANKMASLKENHWPVISTQSSAGQPTKSNGESKKSNKKSAASSAEKAQQQQRNYKNMTRERRVEANARERQRVHTITAAFDTLQSLIPSPEDVSPEIQETVEESIEKTSSSLSNTNQKLSKLSIIKIATAYIMLLSRMSGYDYSEDKSEPSIEDCIQKCSDLLTQETKVKRSRDSVMKIATS